MEKLFYDGPDARITDLVFEVWSPQYQIFRVPDLHDVCFANDGVAPVSARSLAPFGAATVAVGVGWPLMAAPVGSLVAVSALVAVGVVGGVCYLRRQPELALLAHYHGDQVQLYSSKDSRVFGQVKRALVRALEGANH